MAPKRKADKDEKDVKTVSKTESESLKSTKKTRKSAEVLQLVDTIRAFFEPLSVAVKKTKKKGPPPLKDVLEMHFGASRYPQFCTLTDLHQLLHDYSGGVGHAGGFIMACFCRDEISAHSATDPQSVSQALQSAASESLLVFSMNALAGHLTSGTTAIHAATSHSTIHTALHCTGLHYIAGISCLSLISVVSCCRIVLACCYIQLCSIARRSS